MLLLGNDESPRNYEANPYPFRQNSHILYYSGINIPDVAIVLAPDEECLFGPSDSLDELIWNGPQPSLDDLAEAAGIARHAPFSDLPKYLKKLKNSGISLHYPPPYRAGQTQRLAELLDISPEGLGLEASPLLVKAIIEMRSIKSGEEVAEIEKALAVSRRMYLAAMSATRPGIPEAEIAGIIQGEALKSDAAQSYLPIVSTQGEVLHNNSYSNILEDGDLLLIDAGAESPGFYASDITRCLPVSGRFDERQKGIYNVVLEAQLAAIRCAAPGVPNLDVHRAAALAIIKGLCALGLMRGDPEEALAQGAHALFFPHGIGHMLGLDAHDMEDLGDAVGYAPGEKRSNQFGLAYLRLARKLEPGFVITIEPGIYFIPALIADWEGQKRHENFIDYGKVKGYLGFGGIRIEDDLLITESGNRVLGAGIPKTVEEVEAAMGG